MHLSQGSACLIEAHASMNALLCLQYGCEDENEQWLANACLSLAMSDCAIDMVRHPTA